MHTGVIAAPAFHDAEDPMCPFCPGGNEGPWKTYPGEDNDSVTLRAIMNSPEKLGNSLNVGARLKDGTDGRQAADDVRRDPDPIFEHKSHGRYSDQAHHAISGNEILKDHPIEDLLVTGNVISADTGYSVNNCANGVYLPAYPEMYKANDARWGELHGDLKLAIMSLAMADGDGQAHIGPHKNFLFTDAEGNTPPGYPDWVKQLLEEIRGCAMAYSEACPVCRLDEEVRSPLPPPYRLNQALDEISSVVIEHIRTTPAVQWRYFISRYALEYAQSVQVGTITKKRKGRT